MKNSKTPTIPLEFASDTQLAARFSVSRATIWRWAAEGRIPKPTKFSPGCTRWRLEAVEEMLGLQRVSA